MNMKELLILTVQYMKHNLIMLPNRERVEYILRATGVEEGFNTIIKKTGEDELIPVYEERLRAGIKKLEKSEKVEQNEDDDTS